MELWVRSQDKKILQKVSLLHIPNSRTGEDFGIYDIDVMLAHYKTKERALEVLDEIQKLLLPKVKVNTYEIEHSDMNMMYFVEHAISDFSISQSSTYVYEMPEE